MKTNLQPDPNMNEVAGTSSGDVTDATDMTPQYQTDGH